MTAQGPWMSGRPAILMLSTDGPEGWSKLGWMPADADAEVLAKRAELARAVRDDLAAAGLPLAPQEVDPTFAVGASVYRTRSPRSCRWPAIRSPRTATTCSPSICW
jgi:hypothetical protein